MPDKKLALSRRQLLGGLGAVGVASAGAGLGTTALFSDTESFEDNTIQAGTTNLIVRAGVVEDNIGGDGSIALGGTDNGTDTSDTSAGVGITVQDIKPGDSFVLGLDVEVEDNPMYVGVEATEATDGEGLNPEPETSPGIDDNSDPISGAGDLDNMMNVEFGYDSNSPNSGDVQNGQIGPGGSNNPEWSGSLTDFMQLSQIYRGRNGDGGDPPGGHGDGSADATRIGTGALADVDNVTHYAEFSLPDTVGNQVQGDTASWDLVWHAEQVRNNSPPSSVSDLDGSPN